MAGLLGMLTGVTRALDAQRFGIDVAGQNIANVNTAGYTKRVAELASVPSSDKWSAGGGVEIVGARSMRDRLIDRRVREESSAQQRERAISQQMSVVETAVGTAGASLDAALDDFFDAFATLAETPTSASARQEVILQGEALTKAFGDIATRFSDARRDADLQVRSTVEQVNVLAERIASLNAKLAGTVASTPEGAHLRDEVNRALEALAGLVGINAVERENGGFDVDFASGRPLVIGERSYALTLDEDPEGMARVVAGGLDVTGVVRSGQLGGLLHVRDGLIPDYMSGLDLVASDLVREVNALHESGFDAGGQPGLPFFQPLPAVARAAGSMVMNPALTASGGSALVAASGMPGVAGENSVARALAALRDRPVTNGGSSSASEAWGQIVYKVGRDAAAASSSEATQSEVLRQLQNLQDGVSGVSLDEEAADLIRFQRGYEANAKFFTTVDELLDTLIGMV